MSFKNTHRSADWRRIRYVLSLSIGAMVLSLLLMAQLSVEAADPSPQADGGDHPTVLFVNPGFEESGFWKQVTDAMKAATDRFGYELQVVYGDRKWPLMVAHGEDAIRESRPDYLILVNEHQKAPGLLKLAQEHDIPTLFLLNDLTDEQKKELAGPDGEIDNWIGSIVPDNRQAGLEMALSLVESAQERSLDVDGAMNMLTLAGDSTTPASLDRLAGVDDMLALYPQVREIRRLYVNWSRDTAKNRTSLFVTEHRPDIVWAANDAIALGAMEAVESAGMVPGKDVIICGLNWSHEAIEQVIEGRMTMTHGGHFLAGAWVIVMLEDYRRQGHFGDHGKNVAFNMAPLKGKNASRFKKKFPDSEWSKIDFDAFLLSTHPDRKRYSFTIDDILKD